MNPWISTIGWTLIHFVWQGALLAVATAGALRLTRHRSPNARYIIACIGLGAMLASPVVTATNLATFETSLLRGVATSSRHVTNLTLRTPLASSEDPSGSSSSANDAPGVRSGPWLAYVVWGWLSGVLLLIGRFAGGCWRLHRLRIASLAEGLSGWQAASERIARTLRVNVRFRVVESALVDAPGAIGWLKPVIVLPVAALANLAPAQIEAILAHELAHVRRRDYAVNLLQTLAETFLFYHPGVWWVSGRIRQEREHCCDDLAIGVSGEPKSYAAALVELASWRMRKTAPAVCATDGALLARVRRLLRLPQDDEPRSIGGLVAIALSILLLAGGALQSSGLPSGGSGAGPYQLQATNWRVQNTDHFEVHYEPDLDLHAERAGREAERAYERVSLDLKHGLASKVPLVLFRTTSQLEESVRGGLTAPHSASFTEASRDRILLAVDRPADEWQGLLTHEVAHVFGWDIIPGTATPRWILEGLAEYERGSWDPGDLATVRDALRANRIPTVSDLDTGAAGMDPRLASALGHAAFDFIEARRGKAGVRQFLFGLRQNALKGGNTYESALGSSRDEFQRLFEEYLRERFAGSPRQAVADRFDVSETFGLEGEIVAIKYPVPAGLACLELVTTVSGNRQRWALECGDEVGQNVLRALKPGDRVIVTGAPARPPATQRLMIQSLARP